MLKKPTHIALLLSAFATLAIAQSEVGGAALNGAITDPSGAAVPNAKVSIVNAGTGVTRNTTSNETGLYTFSRVPVGAYELTVESAGFKTEKRKEVNLSVGAVVTLDVAGAGGGAERTA